MVEIRRNISVMHDLNKPAKNIKNLSLELVVSKIGLVIVNSGNVAVHKCLDEQNSSIHKVKLTILKELAVLGRYFVRRLGKLVQESFYIYQILEQELFVGDGGIERISWV